MTLPLRTGILGTGDFARRHAAVAATVPQQVEIVALCDRNPGRPEAFREANGLPGAACYRDARVMFETGRLDLVLICLPPYGHGEEVSWAAEAGVHLLIEKPIALSSEAAWHMVAATERARVKTQVGFMNRFGGAVERFRQLQTDGATGKTGLFTGRYFCNALHAAWWRRRDRSGGQLLEQVIHLLDLTRWFLGRPQLVFSRMENLHHQDVPDYTVEDTSGTLIQFEGGGIALVAGSNAAVPGKWTADFRLVAERATADFRSVNEATITHTGVAPPAVEEIRSERDFRQAQLLDLVDAIVRDRPARTPIREGALSLDLALAACRSAAEGVPVRL